MPDDPLRGVFRRRFEIDTPGGAHEENARALGRLGLVCIEEQEYVRCVNGLDRDRCRDAGMCPGRIYLSHATHEDAYYCTDCERLVETSKQQRFTSIRLSPDLDRMRAFLCERIAKSYPQVEEHPVGLFRIRIRTSDLVVCLVDACADPVVLSHAYPYRDKLVYVVGQDRHRLHVPEHVSVFRLADIALGNAEAVFLRILRDLAARPIAMCSPLDVSTTALACSALCGTRPKPCVASKRQATRLQASGCTSWNQLVFCLVDGETIAVRAPGQRLQRYQHHELGMADRRNGRPNKKWQLLEGLCENYGAIPWRGYARTFGAFKEQVSGLRLILQTTFGIHEDPFSDCRQEVGLRSAFQALPALTSALGHVA